MDRGLNQSRSFGVPFIFIVLSTLLLFPSSVIAVHKTMTHWYNVPWTRIAMIDIIGQHVLCFAGTMGKACSRLGKVARRSVGKTQVIGRQQFESAVDTNLQSRFGRLVWGSAEQTGFWARSHWTLEEHHSCGCRQLGWWAMGPCSGRQLGFNEPGCAPKSTHSSSGKMDRGLNQSRSFGVPFIFIVLSTLLLFPSSVIAVHKTMTHWYNVPWTRIAMIDIIGQHVLCFAGTMGKACSRLGKVARRSVGKTQVIGRQQFESAVDTNLQSRFGRLVWGSAEETGFWPRSHWTLEEHHSCGCRQLGWWAMGPCSGR